MSDPASITLSNAEMIAWLESTALDLDPRTEEWRAKDGIITGYERDAAMLRTIAATLAQPARAQAGVAELVAAYRTIETSTLSHDMRVSRLLHAIKQYVGADALAALNGGE